MSKNHFVFIITAKDEFLFPSDTDIETSSEEEKSTGKKWEKIKMENTVTKSLDNDKSNLELKQEEIFAWQFLHKPFDSTSDNSFDVYVVPCLKEKSFQDTKFNKKKANYLESILNQIFGCHSKLDLTYFYLIAHEKDFNTNKPDVLATSLPDQNGNHSRLQGLVEIKHVYLFQHQDICVIYNSLHKLICSSEDTCNKILNLIDKTDEMIRFFQNVNNDTSFLYKKLNHE